MTDSTVTDDVTNAMSDTLVDSMVELAPPVEDMERLVVEGLTADAKWLACKLLYDARGSKLFDEICHQPEYYPTRTELTIMDEHVGAMAGAIGERAAVIEFGSGRGRKSRLLLSALKQPAAYIPIEISRSALLESCAELTVEYPALEILPMCADFNQSITLPQAAHGAARRVLYFPGSSIGNFHPHEAGAFLKRVASMVGPGGGALIGVDLLKDRVVLEAAYDDAAGVTAAFNLNLLHRINRELGADIKVDAFEHRAIFNERENRVEMHLVVRRGHDAQVAGRTIRFMDGETIHTENSYKYDLERFGALARGAGMRTQRVWRDADEWFSVHYLVVDG